MLDITESEERRTVLKGKLRQWFDGKIVRKDLTKKNWQRAPMPFCQFFWRLKPSFSIFQFPSCIGYFLRILFCTFLLELIGH